MTTQEKVLLTFHKWMKHEKWELHSSNGYWYRLDYNSEWPPKDANVCSEEELIEKFKNFCMEKASQS